MVCNVAPRPWSNGPDANLFGLEPNFGCCTANMHQGWPKLTSHLWMKDREEGLAAVSYAPCTVRTTVGQGVAAAVEVSGEYPFKDRVQIKLSLERPESFPLSLRIPAWCDHPVITLNGHELEFQVTSGYARLVQNWQSGDRLDIHLPMEVRTSSRSMYAASIERGPLVYVLPVKENWQMIQQRDMFHDWEVYPASPWKYGLIADTSFEVLEQDMSSAAVLGFRVTGQGEGAGTVNPGLENGRQQRRNSTAASEYGWTAHYGIRVSSVWKREASNWRISSDREAKEMILR